MPFPTIAPAKEMSINRSLAGEEDEPFIDVMLDISKGTTPQNVVEYRPFYVAAKVLQQSPTFQQLRKAENGIEFTNMVRPIESLLRTQMAIDIALQLTIPPGFDCLTELNALCGCAGDGEASGSIIFSAMVA